MIHLQCDNQSTKHDYSHLCTADEWWIHQPTTVTVVFHSLDWTQVLRKHWTTESAHQSEQNKQKSEGELQSSFDWLDASHLVPLVTLCIHCNFYDFFFSDCLQSCPLTPADAALNDSHVFMAYVKGWLWNNNNNIQSCPTGRDQAALSRLRGPHTTRCCNDWCQSFGFMQNQEIGCNSCWSH